MSRILFVIETLFPLGPAHQLVQLVTELTSQAVQVEVVVLKDDEMPPEHAGLSGKLHLLGNQPLTNPISRANCRCVYQLRRIIEASQPDIVHAWCGNSALVTLAATQLPIDRQNKLRLFYTELSLQPEKRFTQQLYENYLSPGFQATVVPHQLALEHLRKNGDTGRIEIIPNRIPLAPINKDVDRSHAREQLLSRLGLPPDVKLAGTVAPLIPRTRLKDLIWATDLLSWTRDDFHFLIFGIGPQADRLRRFAGLTLAKRHIHLLGEPADAGTLLAGLDFYWHSHLLEPLPNNLLVAMSNGIPAISVYGPGTREIIRHQETGFAVNFGARDEFARWTKYLIEQADSASQLADQGQNYVRQRFGGSLAAEYLRMYN